MWLHEPYVQRRSSDEEAEDNEDAERSRNEEAEDTDDSEEEFLVERAA